MRSALLAVYGLVSLVFLGLYYPAVVFGTVRVWLRRLIEEA